ncbi:hypothetical protein [Echinimonas agarilytica]|uniref:Uncharacterized protein n=1 Tax=Echinimonas agarilytica TaxID=1215918 RepID=A0AA41W5J2_9GAMM|nr:hypothetical protein [Echinimonas agarilytica]MCM2679429.1 hypothetical protein [Echinimonas agarilytica]
MQIGSIGGIQPTPTPPEQRPTEQSQQSIERVEQERVRGQESQQRIEQAAQASLERENLQYDQPTPSTSSPVSAYQSVANFEQRQSVEQLVGFDIYV